jgi:hypothetical protein
MEELGMRLLKSVGLPEDAMTPDKIQAAVEAQDELVARLGQIAAGH